jgi:hypothetical protein
MSAVEHTAALPSVASHGPNTTIVILSYTYHPIRTGVLCRLKILPNCGTANMANVLEACAYLIKYPV